MKLWGICGAILGFSAVILGSLAAHGLEGHFTKTYASTPDKIVFGQTVPAKVKYLQDFKTGVDYHFTHAMALLVVSLLARDIKSRWLNVAGWSFLLGTVLFSGSLYLLSLLAIPALGAVVPIGGVLFITGWIALAGHYFSINSDKK